MIQEQGGTSWGLGNLANGMVAPVNAQTFDGCFKRLVGRLTSYTTELEIPSKELIAMGFLRRLTRSVGIDRNS